MTCLPYGSGRSLALLLEGFDGRLLRDCDSDVDGVAGALLWRIGRWLRTQGARRPLFLRVADGGALIIDGRILAVDDFGSFKDLSATPRVVREDEVVCVREAMKMQNIVRADRDPRSRSVKAKAGDPVAADTVLEEFA